MGELLFTIILVTFYSNQHHLIRSVPFSYTHTRACQEALTAESVLFFLCRFGEFIAPNKTLNKSDYYEGHWKDGRMHGLGTYRLAALEWRLLGRMRMCLLGAVL